MAAKPELIKILTFFLIIAGFINCYGEEKESPVLIGVTFSNEGRYKEPSRMIQRSLKLWISEINKKGGLLNREVKLVSYNDKSSSKRAENLYKKLIYEDKVDLVFSPYSTPLTHVVSKITERKKLLMLGIAAASGSPWKDKPRYLFQVYAPAKRQYIGLLDLMAQKGYKTISLLYGTRSEFNKDIVRGVEEWARIFKLNIVYKKGFKNGKKEIPLLISKFKNIDADALIMSAYPPDSYELLNNLKKLKYRPKILTMPIIPAHPGFLKKVGKIGNLVFAPSQWEPSERVPFPGTERFVGMFKKEYKVAPSFHAASAYATCQLYEKAIKTTGSINNTKLRDYMASLDAVTVLGRFKVDPTGMQIGHNSIIIQWQNKKKEIVWPGKMKTANAVF